MRKFKGLKLTLAIAFVALSIVVLIIASSFEIYFNYEMQRKVIASQQQLVAKDAANTVESFVKEKISTMQTSVRLNNILDVSEQDQKLVLEKLLGLEPSFRQLILLDDKGQQIIKVSRLSNIAQKQLTEQVKSNILSSVSNESFYISSVYIDQITNEPMILMAVPIKDLLGNFKGVFISEVNLKFMWDLVGNIKIGNTGLVYVVDRQGNLIAYNDISRVLKRENLINLFEVKEFVENSIPAEEEDTTVSKGISGNDVVSNYVPLGTPDWAVVVELPMQEAYENMIQEIKLIVWIIIFSVGFSVVIGFYISKNITRPIIRLRDAAIIVGSGKLDTQIESTTNDEIGELAQAFNQMINDLNKSRKQLAEYNKTLELKVEERTAELTAKDSKLIDANAKLTALDRQKDEFISVAAHELKTPLTSIRGFSEMLQDDDVLTDVEKSKHYLDLINKNTNRLYDLVLDLVDSSRINIGKLKLNMENVDVYRLFNDIKENMSYAITNKGLITDFNIESKLPMIQADYERVMQVLRNLLSNSIKFTESGLISLNVCREGDFVKFIVKDTGQGIPKENYEYIFSRFYQVDSSATRKVGGSGLGLSICKGLVENMGGKIWFESGIGKGSTFYFTIPIKDKQGFKSLSRNTI